MLENSTVIFYPPVVEGKRITYSWSSAHPFRASSYWIEYPDLESIQGSPGKLAEGFFPLFLAFSLLDTLKIKLPVELPEEVLMRWKKISHILGEKCGRGKPFLHIENGQVAPEYREVAAQKTALLFGGGTESLLTLARMQAQGISPVMVSLGGGRWPGSDPQMNPNKFLMDARLAKDFNLERVNVLTNFREIFDPGAWKYYLKDGVSLMNAVLALPSFVSFLFPVCEQLGISRIVNGNEMMNFPEEYYCFSPSVTDHLSGAAQGTSYESHLTDMLKEEVCFELYRHYPQFARYQYSCWRNDHQRWCYRCQSCLQYFMLMKNSGLPPETAGMNEHLIKSNLDTLIRRVARSDEARPGEIWERIALYPRLRKDPFLSSILENIRKQSLLYHSTPEWVKAPFQGIYHPFVGLAYRMSFLKRWANAFRVPAWLITGKERASGLSFSFTYAGLERHKNYFVRAACSEADEQYLGKRWVWELSGLFDKSLPEHSFTAIEATGMAEKLLRFRTHFHMPVWLKSRIDVPENPEEMDRNHSIKEAQRRIRKHGYQSVATQNPDDFDSFYWDMYVPHVTSTHREAAYVETYETLKSQFESGEIVFLLNDARKVIGGELIHYENGGARMSCVGVRKGYESYVKTGVVGVLFYFTLQRIRQKGIDKIDFGYCRAFLNDGVYQFKTRAGARITEEFHPASGFLMFRFRSLNSAVRSFFVNNPFLTREKGKIRVALFQEKYDPEAVRPWLDDHACRHFGAFSVYAFDRAPAPAAAKGEAARHFAGYEGEVEFKDALSLFPKRPRAWPSPAKREPAPFLSGVDPLPDLALLDQTKS